MKLLVSLVILIVVGLGIVLSVIYFSYGTVDPCGVLRERVRQAMVREGGKLGGFVAGAMPEGMLDGLLTSHYGALSPGRCVSLVLQGEPKEPLGSPPPLPRSQP